MSQGSEINNSCAQRYPLCVFNWRIKMKYVTNKAGVAYLQLCIRMKYVTNKAGVAYLQLCISKNEICYQ